MSHIVPPWGHGCCAIQPERAEGIALKGHGSRLSFWSRVATREKKGYALNVWCCAVATVQYVHKGRQSCNSVGGGRGWWEERILAGWLAGWLANEGSFFGKAETWMRGGGGLEAEGERLRMLLCSR
jgi:hypothetical protein